MKYPLLRDIHLYLGCLFAPLLIFFTLSGVLQTFELHEDRKDGYHAPKIFEQMGEIHTHQRLQTESQEPKSSRPFQVFVLFMSLGLFTTVVLGIIMAFKINRKPLLIILLLALGSFLPALFLYLSSK